MHGKCRSVKNVAAAGLKTLGSDRPTFVYVCLAGVAALIATSPANAANSVSAGVLTVERPTLTSAGFDWRITGDDNHNAKVDVAYRKKGDQAWKTGLPLLRAGGGGEFVGTVPGSGGPNRYPLFKYEVPNMLSGSLLYLTPDTDYEAKLTLSDPDGGSATKTVTFHTRKEPIPAAGGHVYHVYPVDWKGPKQEPNFPSLMAAYFQGGAHYDYENAYPVRVQPGDTILVHAGVYVGDRFHYLTTEPRPGNLSLGNYFDGTYYLTGSGTPDRPIVIKGAGDGEVIFDGAGAQTLFNLMGANYNYFEGITVRNTNVAFLLGIKDIAGASGFTLKHSKLSNVGRAVHEGKHQIRIIRSLAKPSLGRHERQIFRRLAKDQRIVDAQRKRLLLGMRQKLPARRLRRVNRYVCPPEIGIPKQRPP